MKRHASHANGFACRHASTGQRDAEKSRGLIRVVLEEFVKIAHPVEQQHRRVLRLDAPVLLHHGGVLFKLLRAELGF